MDTALIIETKDLREGIADRLNLMLRDACKGDGRLVCTIGDAVEAELRRLVTPFRGHTGPGGDRPVAALQMGLSVEELREIRSLVFQALRGFTPEDRQRSVALLRRALAQWKGI